MTNLFASCGSGKDATCSVKQAVIGSDSESGAAWLADISSDMKKRRNLKSIASPSKAYSGRPFYGWQEKNSQGCGGEVQLD
jgi:hypothetical protein